MYQHRQIDDIRDIDALAYRKIDYDRNIVAPQTDRQIIIEI